MDDCLNFGLQLKAKYEKLVKTKDINASVNLEDGLRNISSATDKEQRHSITVKYKEAAEDEMHKIRLKVKKARDDNLLKNFLGQEGSRSPSIASISSNDSILSDLSSKRKKKKKTNGSGESDADEDGASKYPMYPGMYQPGMYPPPEAMEALMGMYPYMMPMAPYMMANAMGYRPYRGRGAYRGRGSYRGRGRGGYSKGYDDNHDDRYSRSYSRSRSRDRYRKKRRSRSYSRSRSRSR